MILKMDWATTIWCVSSLRWLRESPTDLRRHSNKYLSSPFMAKAAYGNKSCEPFYGSYYRNEKQSGHWTLNNTQWNGFREKRQVFGLSIKSLSLGRHVITHWMQLNDYKLRRKCRVRLFLEARYLYYIKPSLSD